MRHIRSLPGWVKSLYVKDETYQLPRLLEFEFDLVVLIDAAIDARMMMMAALKGTAAPEIGGYEQYATRDVRFITNRNRMDAWLSFEFSAR